MVRIQLTSRAGTIPIRPSRFHAAQLVIVVALSAVAIGAAVYDFMILFGVALAYLTVTLAVGWLFSPEIVHDGE